MSQELLEQPPLDDILIEVFGEWDPCNARWVNVDHAGARAAAKRAWLDFTRRLEAHTDGTMQVSDYGADRWWGLVWKDEGDARSTHVTAV